MSRDRVLFNMEIPIPGKDYLYIETIPWWRPNIKIPPHWHRDSHYGNNTVFRHTMIEIPIPGKLIICYEWGPVVVTCEDSIVSGAL